MNKIDPSYPVDFSRFLISLRKYEVATSQKHIEPPCDEVQKETRSILLKTLCLDEDSYIMPDLSKRYPPMSLADSYRDFNFKDKSKSVLAHKRGSFIPKNDPHFLVSVEPMKFLQEPENFSKQSVAVTQDKRHVVQQQAQRSCGAAVAAMVILAHGKTPDWQSLYMTNLSSDKDILQWIKKAGLEPLSTIILCNDKAPILQSLIDEAGPLMVTIAHPEMGGHKIILDRVFQDSDEAAIREPYHGLALRVRLSTILSWMQDSVIQAVSNRAEA